MEEVVDLSVGKKVLAKAVDKLDTESEEVEIDVMNIAGIQPQPRFSRKQKDRAVSSSIPLMKISQVTEDEMVLDRIHWKLVRDKGSFYVFERRNDIEIEEMRDRGEFE